MHRYSRQLGIQSPGTHAGLQTRESGGPGVHSAVPLCAVLSYGQHRNDERCRVYDLSAVQLQYFDSVRWRQGIAMYRTIAATAIACFSALAGHALAQAPSKDEQAAALDAIRQYALSYTKRLPNYSCTQTNRQTIAVRDLKLTESKEFDCG